MNETDYSVVVAEDEELLLNNLIQKVGRTGPGFQVVGRAQTGADAWALVKELAPDLLITDIRMPVMNGIELLEKVHNRYPLTKFIIISGFSDFDYARSAIRLQVSEYLLKPVDPEELSAALKAVKNSLEIERREYEEIFNAETTRNPPEQVASLLKDYLVKNYNIDINLNLIAANMNYSPGYLTRIFQQAFETTPSRYITGLRIARARHYLLHHPELSIRQIGELVGYQDQGYFSRIFKKQTGFSPFDFRDACPSLRRND